MPLQRRKLATLGQILIRLNKITPEQLKEALLLQKDKFPQKRLGEILIEAGFITAQELHNALAFQFLYPHIEIRNYRLTDKIIGIIPKEVALEHKVIALDKFDNILTVAMFNPLDKKAKDIVERVTGLEVRIFVATREDLEEALQLIYK